MRFRLKGSDPFTLRPTWSQSAKRWRDPATGQFAKDPGKGNRPSPEHYLEPEYIDDHLKKFDDGATRFMTKTNLEKYGPGQVDGTSFVMPKSEADYLLKDAAGDKRALENALGLPEDFLEGQELRRVDFDNPRELNLRIPSGNEAGASDLWIPGGKLPTGNSEAVIDVGELTSKQYKDSAVY